MKSGNKTFKKNCLESEFLLALSLRTFPSTSTTKKGFEKFAYQLLKHNEIYGFSILSIKDLTVENLDSAFCIPNLNTNVKQTWLTYLIKKTNVSYIKISKQTNLYKQVSKSLKKKVIDVHLMNNNGETYTMLVTSPELSIEKSFKKLLAVIKSFAAQMSLQLENKKLTSSFKLVQKENIQLQKNLNEHLNKKNEASEFPKRIIDLNSFPIVNIQRGKLLSYNKALKTLLECNDKYLQTTNYIDIIHPENREEIINLAMRFNLGIEKTVTVQVKILTCKNNTKDILMSMHSIPDDNGVHQYTNCTISDITEEKKLRDALIKSQSQYKQLVEGSPAGIIKTNKRGEITFISARASEILSYRKNQLLGKELKSLIAKSNKNEFKQAMGSLDTTNTKFIGVFECNTKNEGKLIIQCSLGILLDKDNQTQGYLFAFNDATKEIEASRNIIENQATLKSILNSTTEALIAYDENYNVLMINSKARSSLFLLIGIKLTIGIQIPKKYRNHFAPQSFFTSDTDNGYLKLKKIETPKGVRTIEISHNRIKDEKNNVLGVLETGKDITELIKKEELLTQSESQYRFLVDNMNAGVSLVKQNGAHEFINQKGLEIFGIKKSSKKLSQSFWNLFHEEEYNRFEKLKTLLTPNKRVKAQVYRAINDNGETMYLELSISLTGNPINKDTSYLFSYTNITETIEAQKELASREATLNAVLNSTPNGIYAIDKELNVISVNRQAIQDFDDQMNGAISVGKNLSEIISQDVLEKWKENYFDRVFKGESFKYTGPSNGKEYYIENTYAPVITEEGEIIGCLEVSKDISELKRQEIALKESESQYRLLIETSPAGILQVKLDGEVEFISRNGAQMLGHTVEECIGLNGFSFIPSEEHKRIVDTLGELLDKKEEAMMSFQAITKDGSDLKVEGTSKLIKNKEGRVEGLLLVFHDITEKEKTRQALESSKAYFSKMYENSFDPVFIYNYKTEKFIECNNAALKLFEFDSKEEMKKLNRFDLIPNKSAIFPSIEQHKTIKKHYALVKQNKSINLDGVLKTKSGKELIVQVNIIPTQQNEGEAFVLIHDNTDRFKSFQALDQSKKEIEYERALYEAVIKNSFDGIDITEFALENNKYTRPRVVLRNDIMKTFLSEEDKAYASPNELIEISPRLVDSSNNAKLKEKEVKNAIKEIIKGIASDSERMLEFILTTKDNKEYTVESSHKIIKFNDNAYMIRNYKDITARIKQKEIIQKQLEHLNEKNNELQRYIESNMQLENFAYIASHDLKAPLRSVSSFAHLLKTNCYTDLDQKGKRFLDIIAESAMNMQLLIDDLLDYSRINTENIRKVDLNVNRLLSRIQTGLQEEIRKSGAKIYTNNIPDSLFADESMMIQLFQNLVHNAIKFVDNGKKPIITISAAKEGKNYHFIVKDNGIGIGKENADKIFGIFTKLHSNDVYKGTGLGLTICKTIIERHKGIIWVESKQGEGSQFHFIIQSEKSK